MSDYVQKVLREIKSRRDARLIGAELSDHIAEKQALFLERGYDPAAAARMAEAAMGEEAETVGAALSALHRRSRAWDLALWLACMAALGCAAALILFGFVFEYGSGLSTHTPVSLGGMPYQAWVLVAAALIAYRRRLILPPLTAGAALLFSAGGTLSAACFWAELFSGGLARAVAEGKRYGLASASPALRTAHFAVTVFAALLCFGLALLSARRKSARAGKKDAAAGRLLSGALAAFLLFQIGAPVAARCLGGKGDPAGLSLPEYPSADRIVIIFDAEEPSVERYRAGEASYIAIDTRFYSVFTDPSMEIVSATAPYTLPDPVTVFDYPDRFGHYGSDYGSVDRILDRLEPDRLRLFTDYRPYVLVLGIDERTENGVTGSETVWQRRLNWPPDEELTVYFRLFGMTSCEVTLQAEHGKGEPR